MEMCIRKQSSLQPHTNFLQLLRCEKASLTFEAALVMPLLIAFLFVFYASIIAISSQMALQHMAAESAQRIANYIHPVALTTEYVKSELEFDDQLELTDPDSGVRKLIYEIGDMLPPPLDQLVKEGVRGNYWPAANIAFTSLGRDVFHQLMLSDFEDARINKSNVKLVYLQLPDLLYHTDQNVAVALQYDLPFELPFFGYRFSVREQAMHRVWLPDVRPSDYAVISEEENDDFIYVVSLEPNPVKRGRAATVKVSTIPNKQITLNIYYKSGKSVAKNLGTKTANEQGEAEWTWHVSGNTTPGYWQMQFTLEESGYAVEHPFEVGR